MILLTDLNHIPDLTPPVILTIGNFDGLHRGHKRILRKVISRGREEGGTSCVVTFEPHPLKVLHPARAPQLIQTLTQKRDILAHLGVEVLVEIPFTKEFGDLGAEEFARLLASRLRPQEIYIGEDFRFGRGREGSIDLLQRLQGELGFQAEAFQKLKVGPEEVSSTRIRRLLLEGEMEQAVQLLGRPYVIEGVVEHGDGRGKTLGFPTANLAIENELVPAHGVYAVAVDVGEPLLLPGVANLGTRPTFGENRVAVEVHCLTGGRDLYGKKVRCLFFKFLRPETKFASVQELMAQIALDAQAAREYFRTAPLQRRMYY
jgi:riboflavin kinase / FMN adenylyltransferase